MPSEPKQDRFPVVQNWKVGTTFRLASPPNPEALRSAGIQCVELSWKQSDLDIFDPVVKQNCDLIVDNIRDSGIDIWSIHIPYGTLWDPSGLNSAVRTDAIRNIIQVLEIAEQWGIRTAVLHPSWEPVPLEERAARVETCKQSLQSLTEQAKAYGVRLAIECLPRTCLGNTGKEMAELLAAHPDLGICCDVNHLVQELPEHFIQMLGSRIYTTHLSDNDGLDEKHWMPGTGVIHWNEVVASLARAEYWGPLLYEVNHFDPYRLTEHFRECIAALGHSVKPEA